MNLKRSIKRVAGFLRVGVDFERVKMLYGSNPEDVGLRRDYLRECKRRNEDPEIYDEWLREKYGIKDLKFNSSVIYLDNLNLEDFSFLEGVSAPSIREIRIRKCLLGSFEGVSGFEAPKLDHLFIWNSKIESCEGFSEWKFPSLSELTIMVNTFSSAKGMEGFKAPNLEKWILRNNKNLNVNELAFNNLPNLRELYLGLGRLGTLKGLNLSTENLETLSLDFNYFKSLKELDGSKFPRLKKLILLENEITSLEGIEDFGSLEVLDLRDNPIKVTEKEIKRYGLMVEPNQIMEE